MHNAQPFSEGHCGKFILVDVPQFHLETVLSYANPCRLRHIFVEERRSLDRAAGPADADAAMVMGNSTRAWDRYYDLQFQQRGAAAAVSAMTPWRNDMLGGQQSGALVLGGQQSGAIVPIGMELDVNELD